jgi:hypothetical protein
VTDDQTWDDMYGRSHELWKPPEGAWLPKQLACGAGELATDAFIKAGELSAKGGQMLGNAYESVASWFR